MTEKRFIDYFDKDHNYIVQDLQNEDEYQVGFVNCDEDELLNLLNALHEENQKLKSDLARVIEQARKNNELCVSDIRILEKALWYSGCENDYGRLRQLRKEFLK